jgi:hypothetical protein
VHHSQLQKVASPAFTVGGLMYKTCVRPPRRHHAKSCS